MRPRALVTVVMLGATLGLLFASVSTYDFVQHLDRQVHEIHCSFTPGIAESSGATSGCKVTMMSPYSSVLRTSTWGGVPISLPAMSVFAFILFFCLELVVSGRQDDRRAAGFLLLATGLPASTSVVMGTISLVTLGAACKLCIGIYAASAVMLAGAFLLWRRARRSSGGPVATAPLEREVRSTREVVDFRYLAAAFAAGVVIVVAPAVIYFTVAPDHGRFVGACGALADAEDGYGVMVPLGANPGATPAIEVLDPLCPACRAFEHRLETSGLGQRLDRKVLLFPLDNTCNWMVSEAIHPGACVVSEAVLCAEGDANAVVQWAFSEQDEIKKAAATAPAAAEAMVKAKFPALASCIGSARVRSKLNKSLRWAVRNRLQVLTPQLYVDGVKLCDEDVDLGMDFALSRLIKRQLGVTPEKATIDADVQRAPSKPQSNPDTPAPVRPKAADPEEARDSGTGAAAPADGGPKATESAEPVSEVPKEEVPSEEVPAGGSAATEEQP